MGCGSCGTGKPNGCKSNGGCSTGGCNRLNVHDWLANLPLTDMDNVCNVVEVSFKQGSRKEFFRNLTGHYFEKGEFVTVEGVNGFDVGEVSLSGELVRIQMNKRGVKENSDEIKKILRPSSDRDIDTFRISKERERAAQARSRELAIQYNLQMKLSEVEIQADGKKATFFYTADDRVDFRELIKQFASEFKLKVEMRQIGIRQEAAKVGGIGSCGRELCCSTWLHDFKSVNTTAARYQNLSINQTKLSGQCGRLKCCLNFELDTYLDALQHFPDNAESFETAKGTAFLIKKDIFKNLMWYIIQGGSKHYPLTIQRVKEIKELNAKGIRPEELEPVDVTTGKPKEIEPTFVDSVGEISLRSLDKNDRRRRDQQRDQRNNDRRGNNDNRNQRPPSNNDTRRPENKPSAPQQNKNQQRPPQRQQRPQQQNRPPQQPKINIQKPRVEGTDDTKEK
ncbi:MAG TPA: regulatory iron-sulfur-containing complex subunit RicT [Chitinophagaceae bacterium]|jgi:cell fate regulator YaaT (PSP1 superfamily)|nr:regulatory iron-sulfur-containing complex subunit RicT [Chitinophagaceae bacterium]